MTYTVFDPGVSAPLHTLSRSEAEAHFDLFVGSIDERIKILQKLVGDRLLLDFTRVSLVKLDVWYPKAVEPDERYQDEGRPSPETFSIANDLSMYIGETIIRNTSGLSWQLLIHHQKNVSYHRPVIMGWNVPNQEYNVDFDLLLGQYAFRLVQGGTREENLFPRMYDESIVEAYSKVER